ncbi:uncharacterized protein [Diadema antillarum]|uniref:uncharacterized protein n=1 Tax=Diadema antillarum TaxID=105358 RepID=UPI003A89B50B
MDISQLGFPAWNMSKTCLQVYGTKRKTTLDHQEELEGQFCPPAKRAYLKAQESSPMEEMPFMAITQQPAIQEKTVRNLSPCHQHDQQVQKTSSSWLSWQGGKLNEWKEALESCDSVQGREESCEETQSTNIQRLEDDGVVGSSCVEFGGDRRSPDWQTSENLHKQLMKQVESPDLQQVRQETLRAKAEKLQAQLHYMRSMEVESNDYWALPQENHLRMEDELEQARIAMETDYVPDPYQYYCSDIPVPLAGHDSGSSDQVRCYCKPNWEGMLDPIGYI